MFDGWCELINAVMAVVSIIATCCYCDNQSGFNANDASCVAGCICYATVFLDIAKIYYMLYTGPVDCYEYLIILVSVVMLCCVSNSSNHNQTDGIVLALLVTVVTVVLEAVRDVYASV